jgi:hypothetical protein
MIEFRIDASKFRAEIAREIARQDGLSKQVAEQILIEGVNAATELCLKDTGALQDSIVSSSKVTRISPCIYEIKLSNAVDYGAAQEMGPKSGKRMWRFRPHIRPGVFIMLSKAPEVIGRVFNR